MKYCPKCGAQLDSGVQFCPCGFKITEEERKRREQEENLLEARIAATWDRLIAFIVDMMFVTVLSFIISLPLPIPTRQIGLDLFVPNLLDLINWIIGFCYFWFFECYFKGQTIGKKLLSLKTVDENSFGTTTQKKYAINNILRGSIFLFLIDIIIGYIANYDIKGNRLRIMQNASTTVVIKTR